MASNEPEEVILWPSEGNYPRFVEVCEGGVLQTYAEFAAAAQPMLDAMEASGAKVARVDPNPDDMAAWCRANFGHVKSNARAAYAGFVALSLDTDGEAN